MTRFVYVLLACLFTSFLQAQTDVDRDHYLVNHPPDSLFLYNIINKDTITISYLSDPVDSTRYRRIFAGLGSWTIRNTAGKEQWLESIQLAGGWEYRFETPLLLLPATFKTWQSFSAQSEFTAYYRGVRRGKGVFQLEIKVQNKDSASTPLRNFGDCIILTTDANASGAGFPPFSYSIKEWYAHEAGLVKLAGYYNTGPAAQITKIASNLVGARLQGKALEGRN